jgi:hypothetical protein
MVAPAIAIDHHVVMISHHVMEIGGRGSAEEANS